MTMREAKRKKLESQGWKVGSAQEFLGLSNEEVRLIDLKISLGESLRKKRLASNLTQIQLAKVLQSSQSRVAKMESGDPSVSLDLLVRALLALGASNKDIARTISRAA
jgi:hypothetical protein